MASSSSSLSNFDASTVLTYLGLPLDYNPSPATESIPFLNKHLCQLPSHILHGFSAITTPQQRTAVVLIRNRRFNFTQSNPPEFRFPAARRQWPTLWEGAERVEREEAREECVWVETAFLGGEYQAFVGKLGTLLGGYEEERHLERERQAIRGRRDVFLPGADERFDGRRGSSEAGPPESAEAMQEAFLRRIRERFIYGHLEVSIRHV